MHGSDKYLRCFLDQVCFNLEFPYSRRITLILWRLNVLNQVDQWIDKTNLEYKDQRISCDKFASEFAGFYPTEFLKNAFYVVVDKIPKPDFPELREMGLGDFIDMDAAGVTYKNTYYMLSHVADNLRVHFHELVHVAQWNNLGAEAFILRYITEIQCAGYYDAPLEIMAYSLDEHFTDGREKLNVVEYVARTL